LIFYFKAFERQAPNALPKVNQEMTQLEFLNVEAKLNNTLRQCMGAVDTWLKEQELTLSDNKKHKLALLLARYFCDQHGYNEKDIMVLLRNLGGGHFDEEDHESLEIEIQRLLGHTTPVSALRTGMFFRGAIVAALGIFFVISGSLVSIAISRAEMRDILLSEQFSYADPAQIQELRDIVARIMALEEEMGLVPTTFEASLKIVGEPVGILHPERIPEEEYLTVKRHYQNVQGYFTEQKRLRDLKNAAAAAN